MQPDRLPIKKYTEEELKAKIGEPQGPKLRLVKDGEVKETDEEKRERYLRQTQIGVALGLSEEEKPKPKSPEAGMQ